MQVFLSHTSVDKDAVKAVALFLTERGLTVWLDAWQMTAGDSLVGKIGEGIEKSDRLVVFLTPSSVESNWVRKEVATGLVMEIAEDKGLGEKFVIPALLVPCKVPIMLRDKLYANFTNKAFDAACEELFAGIVESPNGPGDERFENGFIRIHPVASPVPGNHELVVEFGVRISPTEGLDIGIKVEGQFTHVTEWFAPPNQPFAGSNAIVTAAYTNVGFRRESPIYVARFASPSVTSTKSFFVRFKGDSPIRVEEAQYLDSFGRAP